MTVADMITAASGLITDFNLLPFITVGAIVGAGAYLYSRFKKASR